MFLQVSVCPHGGGGVRGFILECILVTQLYISVLIASFKRINSDHQILTFLSANCKNNHTGKNLPTQFPFCTFINLGEQLIQNRAGIKGLMKYIATNVATILIAMHCAKSVDGVAVIDLLLNGLSGHEISMAIFRLTEVERAHPPGSATMELVQFLKVLKVPEEQAGN